MTNQAFKKRVWEFFKQYGRDLPWRHTVDPYKILVSEIMLQQTQVDRVIPKYEAWLKRFPSAEALAKSALAPVLTAWRGLGYNRRALALKRAAKMVAAAGKFPTEYEKILELPGVGPYTASAVRAFAFKKPAVMIETNIRTVFIHHFFADKERVEDKDILPLIEKALDRKNPREWYWALMDYGSYLKKEFGNPSRKSKHHAKQSRFAGSARQLRGAVLKNVGMAPVSLAILQEKLGNAGLNPQKEALRATVAALAAEGFLSQQKNKITLAR